MIKVNVCLGRGKGLGQREWGSEREVQGEHVAGMSIVAVGYPHSVIRHLKCRTAEWLYLNILT